MRTLTASWTGPSADSTAILLTIASAFMLAGFIKGVIGLGLPTVAIGLLGLLMTPTQAAAVLVLPALITNVWQAAAGSNLMPLAQRLWPMLVGICIGTVIGTSYLLSGREATVWLGLALLIYSGLGISFTVSTLALGATLAQAGEMNTALAVPSLVALAASLVGMWLGQLVRGMVRSEAFRLCFFLGLLVLGAHLALRGLL